MRDWKGSARDLDKAVSKFGACGSVERAGRSQYCGAIRVRVARHTGGSEHDVIIVRPVSITSEEFSVIRFDGSR